MVTLPTPTSVGPHRPGQLPDSHQLRKDRTIGIVVLLILTALMALMIWLASLGNGGGGNEFYDYWPSMPWLA